MKRLLKRWVACLLSLMIMLHSTFLSVSASVDDNMIFYGDIVSLEDYRGSLSFNPYFFASVPDDICINQLLDSYSSSTSSLGVALSIGQIAGLIAAGAGVIYASQYLDDLGVYLDNALNTAAATVENGRAVYMEWLAKAVNGDIALASAPPWIASAILTSMYNLLTATDSIVSSFYSDSGFAPSVSGSGFAAGTPLYVGNVSSSSSIKRSYIVPNFNYVPLTFAWVNESTLKYGIVTYLLCTDSGYPTSYLDGSTLRSFNVNDLMTIYDSVSSPDGSRYWWRVSSSFGTLSSQEHLQRFISYCLPGTIPFAEDGYNSPSKSFVTHYAQQYYGEGVSDVLGMPEGEEVAPDVLIGGLPDVWVGQGLGADVVTMPDIDLDGSDLINVGDQTALDTSIGTTMDKLATGELTWDDYWLDISGSGPLVDVGEGEGEDVGPPLQLPDWFKDWCKDITGTELDRNSEIDSLLPDLDDGMGQIDDFSASIGDQLKTEFDALHIENFALSTSVLLAIGWIAGWVTQFFNASGEAQVVVLLPMFIGLALLFIGRGSVAMSRVHSSHQRDNRKAAVSSKKGGGTP